MDIQEIKIKICGITNREDALLAVDLGADSLGFIFAESPRQIDSEKARAIIHNLPPFIKTVGVFVNEGSGKIKKIQAECGLDLIQLHGDESPEQCRDLMPYSIKALRIKDEKDIEGIDIYKSTVRAMLLDTYQKGKAGGTGKTFDWSLALKAKETGIPIILAGGLSPENIQEAITTVKPYAVDINSGIEERPGKKSQELMKLLFEKIMLVK
jgi:phosphoribosylanthranilate isomerase